MPLADDIKSEVTNILRSQWTTREGREVPGDTDIGLANDGIWLDAAVLYADLVDSSGLVGSFEPEFAAEIYKCYLTTACRIIRDNGGVITAFDGDRVMAVFVGRSKNSSATRCALKINYAIKKIVNPAIRAQYPKTTYSVDHVVGIDSGQVLAAVTGIRGSKDLVWVGPAANTAAKLCEIRTSSATWITDRVYAKLSRRIKLLNQRPVWEPLTWNGSTIYRSNCRLRIDDRPNWSR